MSLLTAKSVTPATFETIVIYKSKTKDVELKVSFINETVWLSQDQMTKLFGRERTVITKHINNVFREGELPQKSNVQNMHIANSDKPVKYYSLDVVISVGYRVKSLEGTRFRQWASKIIQDHILKGYTINRNRLKSGYEGFLKAVADVKSLLPHDSKVDSVSILELISMFADTWMSLDAYDKDVLVTQGITKRRVVLTANKLNQALLSLKHALIVKGEATELFGTECTKDSIAGIVGNVMQGVGDQDVYASVEEKAAHLLYFIIKNHPFIDGNKRSGAYAFIWFLQQAKILDTSRITPPALTALTLLIAESDPKDKNKMVGLVCNILMKRSGS